MTWPTTAARGDEDNFFAFSVGLGWDGMAAGARRASQRKRSGVFFYYYIFSLSVLVAFQRVPQPGLEVFLKTLCL